MRNGTSLLKGEGGQLLIYVLIIVLVAALIIPPLLGLTYSGLRSSSMGHEKMQRFYAADAGVEDAIHQVINRGNETDPNPKVPWDFGPSNAITYTIKDEGGNNKDINGCYVELYIERVGPGNETYFIGSTSTVITEGTEGTGAKIEAQVTILTSSQTLTRPKPGPTGLSPFQYALASLDPDSTLRVTAAGGQNPTEVAGDLYSAGNMIIDPAVYITPDKTTGKASSAWAGGTMTIGVGSSISGDAHSNGDMLLESGAKVMNNAYGNGSITLVTGATTIGNSSYAKANITLNDDSTIGGSAEAEGSIGVLHSSTAHPATKTEIFGNALAHQNITVNGANVDSNNKAIAVIRGNATAGGTITVLQPVKVKVGKIWVWYDGGVINGIKTPNVLPPPVALTLPPMPELRNPEIPYWQQYYFCQAHGEAVPDWPVPGDPAYPALTNLCTGFIPWGSYDYGTIDLKNGESISLGPAHVQKTDPKDKYAINLYSNVQLNLTGTIYVDGDVMIDNNCQILGGGKLVATGDITIMNSIVGTGIATNFPLIMSINGGITAYNNGQMDGVFYAPNGAVNLGVDDYVTGSVVGKSVTVKNALTAVYDQIVSQIPGLPGGNITIENPGTETYEVLNYLGVNIDWYNVIK